MFDSKELPLTFLGQGQPWTSLLLICGSFGLLEYACVATCDMKERIKGAEKKTQKVLEEQVRGSNGGGERVGSWITMARVQGWLIVSDTLQF